MKNETTKPSNWSLVITAGIAAAITAIIIIFVQVGNDGNTNKVDAMDIPTVAVTAPVETEPVVTIPEETVSEPKEWAYDDSLKAEENIFIYLTEYLGYSDAAACGIIGNIAHETGWRFNPDAGSPNSCYGLIQWLGSRLKNLKSWCAENGKDYTSIQGQLDFMHWELQNDDPYGTYEHLKEYEDSADGAYDAGWYFCYWYERPNNKGDRAKLRGREAQKYYQALVLDVD